ncbi:proline iminopeptidase-family hydrolase [Hymenobacter fodinae]|uniref:Alpha/beta fold hydrolase n=1 Tax=Hymenobacter fodinae TaxID=2510796 RepID=A0A4Z0PCI5_9BACT|nr:proline iminopeptidase-family hydrolase [Hymenobacter fodinae]TGE09389.1 alpha/beta fold hydrolase [Hymenobacter fodinae]
MPAPLLSRLTGLALATSLLLAGCQQKPDAPSAPAAESPNTVTTGYLQPFETGVRSGGVQMIPVKTPKGTFNVWTKRFGTGKIKVLLLHGGPAMTHEYFECFESFFPQEGIQFYEYDQLGSYYSDQPQDDDLWRTERFVDEVEQVRQALGIDKFYVLGHSWGGILALEYALKHQDHLAGLVISNMVASIPRYDAYNKTLRAQLRPSLLDSLEKFEVKKDYHNPTYEALVIKNYYSQHLLRLPEPPEPAARSFKHVNQHVYELMQGPNEFKTAGRLLTWDRWNDLDKITVPTLMIGGQYDTMNPKDMEKMSRKVKQGNYLLCPQGSHMSMWDDQQTYFRGLIRFLKSVNDGTFKTGTTL